MEDSETKELTSSPNDLHTQLVNIITASKQSFVLIGKLLYTLKEKNKFKDAVGAGIDTWEDYIAQPEINLTRGEADRLVQIYEQFVLKYGFDEGLISEIPIKNLHYLLPLAKRGQVEMEELLYAAKELKQKDFKERVGDLKFGDTRTYEYLIMRRCVETGTLQKVHEVGSDQIMAAFGLS